MKAKLPKKTIGQLLVASLLTDYQQVTDSWPIQYKNLYRKTSSNPSQLIDSQRQSDKSTNQVYN